MKDRIADQHGDRLRPNINPKGRNGEPCLDVAETSVVEAVGACVKGGMANLFELHVVQVRWKGFTE
jgi:hypothetical protein